MLKASCQQLWLNCRQSRNNLVFAPAGSVLRSRPVLTNGSAPTGTIYLECHLMRTAHFTTDPKHEFRTPIFMYSRKLMGR